MPTTTGSGQIVMGTGDTPAVKPPPAQQITGSIATAAANKTLTDQAAHADAFKELGAGQKGSGRRRTKRRRMQGGASQNVTPSTLPTASSVPGGNPTDVATRMANTAAQVKAFGVYDKLADAQPMQVKAGGFRLRGAEDLYPGSGTESSTKRKRKTKKKHGRRHRRTHRRSRRKHRNIRRRSRRNV
jgi:hypothetical protein